MQTRFDAVCSGSEGERASAAERLATAAAQQRESEERDALLQRRNGGGGEQRRDSAAVGGPRRRTRQEFDDDQEMADEDAEIEQQHAAVSEVIANYVPDLLCLQEVINRDSADRLIRTLKQGG